MSHTKWYPHTDLKLKHFTRHKANKSSSLSPLDDHSTEAREEHPWMAGFHWPSFCMRENSKAFAYRAHADVLCFPRHYIIEIEAPGLRHTSTDRVHVEWMSPRTIAVSADIPESQGCEEGKDRDQERSDSAPEACEGSVKERHRGYWRRTFTLPEDSVVGIEPDTGVNGKGVLDWKIEDGLIKVFVPRRNPGTATEAA